MDYLENAKEIVDKYEEVIAAYGYGSAFFNQSGYTKNTKKIIDLIFVVNDIKKWHENNFKINKNDYTKYTKAIYKYTPKKVLEFGTDIIYNVVKNDKDFAYKYGLVEEQKLLEDLNTWKHFFLCGRMQKPIYTIKDNTIINDAIKENRAYALLVSLLIINKDVITLKELFEQVCRLSYDGDVRTLGAENPNKISNIVNGNYQNFKEIYCNSPYLDIKGEYAFVDLDLVYNDIEFLPSGILNKLSEEQYYSVQKLSNTIKNKNRRESIIHPLKQLYVCGVGISIEYMKEKHKKKCLK